MARGGENLTPEQMTQVQNAMNKVVAAGVETANVRTFKDMARRLYEMLRDTNRKLWEVMKGFCATRGTSTATCMRSWALTR